MADKALRAGQLRKLSADEINSLLAKDGIPFDFDTSREEKIDLLVKNSYPVRDVPNVREGSSRGMAFRSLVNRDGNPTTGVTLEEIIEMILCAGKVLERDTAINIFQNACWQLVRYYGFEVTETDGRFTATKRVRYPLPSADDDVYDEVDEESEWEDDPAEEDSVAEESSVVEEEKISVSHPGQHVAY